MSGQLHIPAVNCLRVESNFDEKKYPFGKRSKIFQVSHKKAFSRFIIHPNESVSRLNTDELLLVASASHKFLNTCPSSGVS